MSAETETRAEPTPGPWRTPGPTETKMAPIHTDETVVAHVGAKSLDYEENAANARLIAAAPELLEAAEEAARLCETFHDKHVEGLTESWDRSDRPKAIAAVRRKLHTAIAKAKEDPDA